MGAGAAAGETLACFGVTEPGTGSDAGNLTTRARRDGRRLAAVRREGVHHERDLGRRGAGVRPHRRGRAARGDGVPGPDGADGFEAREIKGKLGLRGQATATLHLDEVRVPDANRLGEEGAGFRVAMSALDKGRMRHLGRLRRHRPRLLCDGGDRATPSSGSSSASRSPPTSWCRSSWPTPRSTSTPAGC